MTQVGTARKEVFMAPLWNAYIANILNQLTMTQKKKDSRVKVMHEVLEGEHKASRKQIKKVLEYM